MSNPPTGDEYFPITSTKCYRLNYLINKSYSDTKLWINARRFILLCPFDNGFLNIDTKTLESKLELSILLYANARNSALVYSIIPQMN